MLEYRRQRQAWVVSHLVWKAAMRRRRESLQCLRVTYLSDSGCSDTCIGILVDSDTHFRLPPGLACDSCSCRVYSKSGGTRVVPRRCSVQRQGYTKGDVPEVRRRV